MFDPLSEEAIDNSILSAFKSQYTTRLDREIPYFSGEGIYAITYFGSLPMYAEICHNVIYVGMSKRRSSRSSLKPSKSPLYSRIKNHINSISQATNLNPSWFEVSWLEMTEMFIDRGEQILLDTYKPIWNCVISGFGNNNPGSGRRAQKLSEWDMLHPGRLWASSHPTPSKIDLESAKNKIKNHLLSISK